MRREITLENYKEILGDENKINFSYICVAEYLSEDFIEHFKEKIKWDHIGTHQQLSEEFIRKYQNRLNWHSISWDQELSESFILEFQEKIKWRYLSFRQKLSCEFIENNLYRLNIDKIVESQALTNEFCEKYKVQNNFLNTAFHCGYEKRIIYRTKSEPELIHIGCFTGNMNEAIEAISTKYQDDEKIKNHYISKVTECFDETLERK